MPSESPDASLWRVLGQRPQPLAQLVQAEPSGAPVWVSSFPVAHCIAEPLAKDGVYWAGDAAHIHSPIEARGMNLGLEDAWGFIRAGIQPLTFGNLLNQFQKPQKPFALL